MFVCDILSVRSVLHKTFTFDAILVYFRLKCTRIVLENESFSLHRTFPVLL